MRDFFYFLRHAYHAARYDDPVSALNADLLEPWWWNRLGLRRFL